MSDNYSSMEQRVMDALAVASDYGHIDGAHHKSWVIDQMVRALLGDEYDGWIGAFMSPLWDEGVAP